MARKNLDSGQGANLAAFTSGSFLPDANRLVLAFVMNRRAATGPSVPPSAVQGNNLTWVQVSFFALAPNGPCLSCYRALGPAPSAGQLTITFGQPQALCAWSIVEYDNIDLTSPDGTSAVLQPKFRVGAATTTFDLQLDDPLKAADSVVVGAIALTANRQITPGIGTAEIHETAAALGTLQTEDRITGGQNLSWTWTGDADLVAMALELKAPSIPPLAKAFNVEALVRRFEPTLFFHPQEKFFPSDAKRYVERCALWRAELPSLSRNTWGGNSGAPFPRFPMVTHGAIAAVNGEPGLFLGYLPADTETEKSFLELAGWKNAAGNAQPDVTDTSQNTYTNRDKIKDLYDTDLEASRFWYHAEFFDEAKLRKLLQRVPAPDLVKVLDKRKGGNPAKELALLCYYLFFPAHEESLPATCDNVEAKEFACFGGEWACLALLLERNGPADTFAPAFIGHTGRWVADSSGQLVAGQSPIDGAGRLAMRVSPTTLGEIGGRPKVFVARGTHSFYRDTSPVTNSPSTQSRDCGREEGGPTLVPAAKPIDFVWPPMVLFWKFVSGGLLHLVSGGLSLPVGAIAGTAWGVVEFATPDTPSSKDVDGVTNDEVAAEADAVVVHPDGMEVPPEWTNHRPWRTRQGLSINGRRYDFLVDRATQSWWPGDTEEGSRFSGLWGPQVESDPIGRRSGMRFPSFWAAFFLALEDGGF